MNQGCGGQRVGARLPRLFPVDRGQVHQRRRALGAVGLQETEQHGLCAQASYNFVTRTGPKGPDGPPWFRCSHCGERWSDRSGPERREPGDKPRTYQAVLRRTSPVFVEKAIGLIGSYRSGNPVGILAT